MTTLGDVIRRYQTVHTQVDLYGATVKFMEENGVRFKAIGDALRQDEGLSRDEAMQLPHDTILTENAQARYEEWEEFLRHNEVPA